MTEQLNKGQGDTKEPSNKDEGDPGAKSTKQTTPVPGLSNIIDHPLQIGPMGDHPASDVDTGPEEPIREQVRKGS